MKAFKKYTHIENSYQNEYIDKIRETVSPDMLWSVSEKVDGANFSFVTNGKEVRCGKRSGLIGENEGFYRYETVLAKYQQNVLDLFFLIQKDYPETVQIEFFGELYGGYYPGMKGCPGAIQNRIIYNPQQDFYGFDIFLVSEEGVSEGIWLGVDEVQKYYSENGFFYAEEILRGTLDECLKYPNDFPSTITERLGLDPIEGNITEGVVIKPVTPQFFRNGDRIVIKNKNDKFTERMKKERPVKEVVPLAPHVVKEIEEILAFVNINKLCNVESHLGDISFPKDFGNIMKEFTKDIMEDYLKERKVQFAALEKKDQKAVTGAMNKAAAETIKEKHIKGVH